MKAIILFSSIFYILGLKIGHKIDLFKSSNSIEKITTKANVVKEAAKVVYFNDEVKAKSDTDSLKNIESHDTQVRQKNHL